MRSACDLEPCIRYEAPTRAPSAGGDCNHGVTHLRGRVCQAGASSSGCWRVICRFRSCLQVAAGDVQQTGFCWMGRSIVCSTWVEATLQRRTAFHSGRHWRRNVRRILRDEDRAARPYGARVLLDAGRFLVSEHVQNLANIGFNVPGAIPPSSDPGVPRELVWGIPWRGNTEFPGVAYCTGGKSILLGWLVPAPDRRRPLAVAGRHGSVPRRYYIDIESEIGVVAGHRLHLRRARRRAACRLRERCRGHADIDTSIGTSGVRDRAAGGQGSPPVSGFFSFDKLQQPSGPGRCHTR